MASYEFGKAEVCEWVRRNFSKGDRCLDVGACDGNWFNRLGDHLMMDAIEVYEPYVAVNRLHSKYNSVIVGDITEYEYEWYDLIIFGDVIEHMTVEQAKKVLDYANPRCKDMIIAVPYLYKQDAINGNTYERHLQPELTEELFRQRYPGYSVLVRPNAQYGYWHKAERSV